MIPQVRFYEFDNRSMDNTSWKCGFYFNSISHSRDIARTKDSEDGESQTADNPGAASIQGNGARGFSLANELVRLVGGIGPSRRFASHDGAAIRGSAGVLGPFV
jgi:hypothetical protein